MNLYENTVNLGFHPASDGLHLRNRDDASTEQEKKRNYNETKTNGTIQKPWQCEHSIAVYPHLQMKLYRLSAPGVLSKVRGVET